jgi:hypothetical protein
MAENTVKRVIFYVVSQKAEIKSDSAKNEPDFTRGKTCELIGLFDKLIDLSISELEEPNVLNNPFYIEEIDKKIANTKINNSNHISF